MDSKESTVIVLSGASGYPEIIPPMLEHRALRNTHWFPDIFWRLDS